MESQMHHTLSAATVKSAAAGRWAEILTHVAGIPADVLDGRHHPCPRCGGADRFRYIEPNDGAVYRNQCFNKNNGDGLAAIMHYAGYGFPEAMNKTAEFLGLASSNVNGKPTAASRVVAKYDYRDEFGDLLFQVVRFDPKDFRQRKPKPGGGWNWSVKGVRVVPYRLLELLAEPTRPVAIPEGERDVDNLTRIGIRATCNAGGGVNGLPSTRLSFAADGL
jgi:hypothetical protein